MKESSFAVMVTVNYVLNFEIFVVVDKTRQRFTTKRYKKIISSCVNTNCQIYKVLYNMAIVQYCCFVCG